MHAADVPLFDALRAPLAAWAVGAARWGTPRQLQGLQRQRLAALLEATAPGSRWVRRALAGRDPAEVELAELPVMRKGTRMRHFDAWVADPRLRLPALREFVADPGRIGSAYAGEFMVWESSGSGGEPALFVHDRAAMAVYDALEAMRRPMLQPWRRWLDPAGMAERTAFVGATGGHFASTVSFERLRRLHPALADAMRGFSFLLPVAELVAQLNRYRPTIIATYPTAALLLAEEATAGRLAFAPCEVWTGGEALSEATRGFVERSFGCAVAHSYGASEFLPLASECGRHALHLNSDWVLLEPVDRRGRPVPVGAPCHTTLLTNLANHAQPLIRCDLGDRVRFVPDRCACGSPLPVIEVQGRCDDALLIDDDAGHPVRLLPLALTTVIEEQAGVFSFQIEQRGPRELLLRVAQGGAAGAAALCRARAALTDHLKLQGAPGVAIEARCGEPALRGRTGKAPRVKAGRRR